MKRTAVTWTAFYPVTLVLVHKKAEIYEFYSFVTKGTCPVLTDFSRTFFATILHSKVGRFVNVFWHISTFLWYLKSSSKHYISKNNNIMTHILLQAGCTMTVYGWRATTAYPRAAAPSQPESFPRIAAYGRPGSTAGGQSPTGIMPSSWRTTWSWPPCGWAGCERRGWRTVSGLTWRV